MKTTKDLINSALDYISTHVIDNILPAPANVKDLKKSNSNNGSVSATEVSDDLHSQNCDLAQEQDYSKINSNSLYKIHSQSNVNILTDDQKNILIQGMIVGREQHKLDDSNVVTPKISCVTSLNKKIDKDYIDKLKEEIRACGVEHPKYIYTIEDNNKSKRTYSKFIKLKGDKI